MNQFSSAREAKEFLVSRIVDEAQREGVSLSEVERKMLYFTETGWTLPNIMEVSDEFNRDYDQNEYEKKIASLIKSAVKRNRKENSEEAESWRNAVRKLSNEDHYILVMIGQAGVPTGRVSDRWTGNRIGVIFVCIVVALMVTARYLGLWIPRAGTEFGSYTVNQRVGTLVGYMWLFFVVLALCFLALSQLDHARGLKAISGLFAKGLRKLSGIRAK
jgi:hypothetical protein